MNLVEYVEKNGSVIVIDDLLDLEKQNALQDFIFSEREDKTFLNWYFMHQTVYSEDRRFDEKYFKDGQFFSHTMLNELNPDVNSSSFEIIGFLIRNLKEKIQDVDHINALRGKLNLYTKDESFENFLSHPPHIDNKNSHAVLLYFVNDSDGDLILFNEKEVEGVSRDEIKSKDENSYGGYTIKKRITPKKGRGVLFDGRHYHASNPSRKSNFRCTVNLNLE